MQEPTFASLEFEQKKRQTRRERFLERIDALVPWTALEARVEPVYPKPGRGRRPYPLAVMLRVHCVQLCYNLSDPAMEDLLYEAESVRRFCGLNLSGPIPDESTILHFRHLLERHQLGAALLETINAHLAGQGLRLQAGTIVDASIIAAPSSTKNQARARDPEMHQTRKGNEWHFGMKLHIGVDAISGLTHSLSTTAANTADVTEAHRLLHGAEREAWGDAGYQGVERRPELADSTVEWRVAMRPGRRRRLPPDHRLALRERERASLRAKVEHPFLYIKRRFGYDKHSLSLMAVSSPRPSRDRQIAHACVNSDRISFSRTPASFCSSLKSSRIARSAQAHASRSPVTDPRQSDGVHGLRDQLRLASFRP